MLTKTIQHLDLDKKPTETVVYFNLTKAEVVELNIRNDLQLIIESKDRNEIMDTFRRIMSASYGKRNRDGEFIKEGFPAFAASEAYSELFLEIWQSDNDYGSDFIKSIMPEEISDPGSKADIPDNLAKLPSMQGYKKPQAPQAPTPAPEPVNATPQSQADQNDYLEFQAFKAARDAKNAQPIIARDELI